MRVYGVANASLAIGAPQKWLDNLLSRNEVPGIEQGGQGVDRRISADALERLLIVWTLHHECGLSVSSALALAERLLDRPDGHLDLAMGLELRVSRPALRHQLEQTVVEATSAWLTPRRGRRATHPKNESAGEDRSPALRKSPDAA